MLERIDETHFVPKAERPYRDEDGLLGMCGMLRTVRSQHDSGFHGLVNFYGGEYLTMDDKPAHPSSGVMHCGSSVSDCKTGEPLKYVYHEYNAKFADGQLVSIDLVPREPSLASVEGRA